MKTTYAVAAKDILVDLLDGLDQMRVGRCLIQCLDRRFIRDQVRHIMPELIRQQIVLFDRDQEDDVHLVLLPADLLIQHGHRDKGRQRERDAPAA